MTVPSGSPFGSQTHLTLLGEFVNHVDDPAVAQRFLDRYRPLIRHYLSAFHGRLHDYEDLEQDILVKIVKGLKKFDRQRVGSFRKWLKMVVRSVQSDWFQEMVRNKRIQFLSVSQIEDQAEQFATRFEEEHDLDLMEKAMKLARASLAPTTWTMFEQAKLQRLAAAKVAENHGVSVLTVYKACRRVMEKIRAAMKLLDRKQEGLP
jgi:RNA polymerase sigma factor (sigma-70 family)